MCSYSSVFGPQSNHIILINCGGTVDIVETLEPSEEKVFFIADSHRPYDVCNIYNDGQVSNLGSFINFIIL